MDYSHNERSTRRARLVAGASAKTQIFWGYLNLVKFSNPTNCKKVDFFSSQTPTTKFDYYLFKLRTLEASKIDFIATAE